MRCCLLTLLKIATFLAFPAWADSAPSTFSISSNYISSLLGDPATNTIHRDSSGALWIGSQDGLYLYEGSQIFAFDSHQTAPYWIPDSNVIEVLEDESGDVFIQSYTMGIYVRRKGKTGFEKLDFPREIGNDKAVKIAIALKHKLVIAHEHGLIVYENNLDRFIPIAIESNIHNIIALEVSSHNDNLVAISTPEATQIIKIDPKTYKSRTIQTLDVSASALAFSPTGDLYLGTTEGSILRFPSFSDSVSQKTEFSFSESTHISDIQVRDAGIFIATDHGLHYASEDLMELTDISSAGNGLSSLVIRRLRADGERTWICTLGGLDVISTNGFTSSTFGKDKTGDVTALAEDEKDNLWLGTYDGLWRLNDEDSTIDPYLADKNGNKLLDNRITAASFGDGQLWLGFAGSGIQSLNTADDILLSHSLPTDRVFVNDILVTSTAVWVATGDDGLLMKAKDGDFVKVAPNPRMDNQQITNLFELTKDHILMFSENEALIYTPKNNQLTKLNFSFGIENTKPILYSVNGLADGYLWIGTKNHGLFYSKQPLSLDQPIPLKQMSSDYFWNQFSALSIEIDNAGTIWASTDKGIVSVAADGSSFSTFTTSEGLRRNPFNLNASILRADGSISFGGLKGISNFNPSEVKAPKKAGTPKVVRIERNGALIYTFLYRSRDRIFAKSESSPIQIHFNTLEFLDATATVYRHKLTPHDKTWIENGNKTSASYSNLSPGEYTFHVQAANSSGIWNSDGASIDLTVLPPPWRTWWAYCLYALLLCMLFWTAHRIYYSFVIDRRAKSLALEMHLAEERADDDMQEQVELQQGVVQSAYEHNKSTISLVNEFLEQDPSAGRIALHKQKIRIAVLSDVDECLFFQAGDPVVDMYKLTEMIFEKVLPTATSDNTAIITINDTTRNLIDSRLASSVSLILTELIQNSVLHAFPQETPAKFVQVHFSRSELGDKEGDYWLLRVSDNGVGFEEPIHRDYETDSGLEFVHRLVTRLGGTTEVTNGEGATVNIRFPGDFVS